MYRIHRILPVFMAVALLAASVTVVSAAVWTDQADYAPGDTVTISGDNSNFAEGGYLPGETVHVDVSGPNGWTATCDATADDAGAWSCQVTLDPDPEIAVGEYSYTATGVDSGTTESGSFTDGSVFVRAAIPGPTYVSVTFEGDGVGGDPDDVYSWTDATCGDSAGTIYKWLPGDEITNTDGTYDVADGMSNIGSVEVHAPSPITFSVNGPHHFLP